MACVERFATREPKPTGKMFLKELSDRALAPCALESRMLEVRGSLEREPELLLSLLKSRGERT
jgi:hypothetical protein